MYSQIGGLLGKITDIFNLFMYTFQSPKVMEIIISVLTFRSETTFDILFSPMYPQKFTLGWTTKTKHSCVNNRIKGGMNIQQKKKNKFKTTNKIIYTTKQKLNETTTSNEFDVRFASKLPWKYEIKIMANGNCNFYEII